MVRLLLVDDEINVLKALNRMLWRCLPGQETIVELCTDPIGALQLCRETDFDIVVADFRMPRMNGVEFLTAVKAAQPDAIRVMLSAASDFNVILDAINTAEIFHYLRKPWSPDELMDVVQKAWARREYLLNERQQEAPPHANRATHDALTGLPGRIKFCADLSGAMAETGERAGHMAVLFLGLDHFRSINAANGIEAGDFVLCETAKRIRRAVAPGAAMARVGGDEFGFVLCGLVDPQEAVTVAKNIMEAMSPPLSWGDVQVHVQATIGIALCEAGCADLDGGLLQKAEDAMRYAKDHGGGAWQLHSPELDAYSRRKAHLRAQTQQRFESLTAREREVLQMLVSGKSNKMIASVMGISNRTVENHRAKVMEKTRAESLPDLIQMTWRDLA